MGFSETKKLHKESKLEIKSVHGGYLVQEKNTIVFSKNKMDCYQSSGTYYFNNGSIIKIYFQKLIDNGLVINGEYYVSLVFNKLKEAGLDVYIYNIPYFLQWGTPEDLEEYLYWSDYFLHDKK